MIKPGNIVKFKKLNKNFTYIFEDSCMIRSIDYVAESLEEIKGMLL